MALGTFTSGIENPNLGNLTSSVYSPKELPSSRGLGFPSRRSGPFVPPTMGYYGGRGVGARRAPRHRPEHHPGRSYLIAALLLAHLAVPAQLLQPLRLDAVGDGLGTEEIRLPHGSSSDPPTSSPAAVPVSVPTPTGGACPRPGTDSLPPLPAARRRGAGALTFSGAVVEAPPCSPGGPRSRFTSRNGNGRGPGTGAVP